MCYVLTCTCGTSGIVGCLWKGVGLGGGETPFLLSTLLCTCVPCPCVTSKKDRIKYSSCWMIFFLKYRLRVLGIPGLPWRMLGRLPCHHGGLRLCPSQTCLAHLPPPILDPGSRSGNSGEDTTEWPPGGLFPLSGWGPRKCPPIPAASPASGLAWMVWTLKHGGR